MTGPAQWMPVFGGVILVAIAGYFGFQALDGIGLSMQPGIAVVIGKEYRPAKKTYRTDVIGNQTRVVPQVNPEMYILKLRIGEKETVGLVERDLFNTLSNGDRLSVTYQRRRVTGGLQVVGVQGDRH